MHFEIWIKIEWKGIKLRTKGEKEEKYLKGAILGTGLQRIVWERDPPLCKHLRKREKKASGCSDFPPGCCLSGEGEVFVGSGSVQCPVPGCYRWQFCQKSLSCCQLHGGDTASDGWCVHVRCRILPVRTSHQLYALSLIQTHMHWIKYCLPGFSKATGSCYWRNKCLNSVYVGFILSLIICLLASHLRTVILQFQTHMIFFLSLNRKEKFWRTVVALFHYNDSVLMLSRMQNYHKKIITGSHCKVFWSYMICSWINE